MACIAWLGSVWQLSCREPQVGNIVEYPLRSIETEDFQDGRSHGVGLLVGRNIDRGAFAQSLGKAQDTSFSSTAAHNESNLNYNKALGPA